MRRVAPACSVMPGFVAAGRRIAIAILGAVLMAGCGLALNPNALATTAIPLAGGPGPVAFGDLAYDQRLGRVMVPAGGTGQLALIDPQTLGVKYLAGYSKSDGAGRSPAGPVSAVVARGLLFAVDSGQQRLMVSDPSTGKIVGSSPLQAVPDHIRFVAATSELWVTEPAKQQIEVFSLPAQDAAMPAPGGTIAVAEGPEALAIDRRRGLAYTNQPAVGKTAVIQVQTRGIIGEWGNGCSKARGLALDEQHGLLFIACGEGKVVVLDTSDGGQQVTSYNFGADLDDVGYNPRLRHVYVPSGASAILAVLGLNLPAAASGGVAENGVLPGPAQTASPSLLGDQARLALLGTADTAVNANCLATDDYDNLWVCNPNKGQILLITDTFPASGDGS